MRLIGIDGCRAGWIVASSDADLRDLRFEIIATNEIQSLLERSSDNDDIIAIDIPIGLAESAPRGCDLAARQYLKSPRASSVFPAPCRAALAATSHREASELNLRAGGRGLPIQTFHILNKIRVVDEAIAPRWQEWVRESHPEVIFARLLGQGHGLIAPKRSPDGRDLRGRLLEQRLPRFDALEVLRNLGRAMLEVDDLLDALACLVAAQNIARNNALILPAGTVERDRRGLRMEIVA